MMMGDTINHAILSTLYLHVSAVQATDGPINEIYVDKGNYMHSVITLMSYQSILLATCEDTMCQIYLYVTIKLNVVAFGESVVWVIVNLI